MRVVIAMSASENDMDQIFIDHLCYFCPWRLSPGNNQPIIVNYYVHLHFCLGQRLRPRPFFDVIAFLVRLLASCIRLMVTQWRQKLHRPWSLMFLCQGHGSQPWVSIENSPTSYDIGTPAALEPGTRKTSWALGTGFP